MLKVRQVTNKPCTWTEWELLSHPGLISYRILMHIKQEAQFFPSKWFPENEFLLFLFFSCNTFLKRYRYRQVTWRLFSMKILLYSFHPSSHFYQSNEVNKTVESPHSLHKLRKWRDINWLKPGHETKQLLVCQLFRHLQIFDSLVFNLLTQFFKVCSLYVLSLHFLWSLFFPTKESNLNDSCFIHE